MELRVKQIVGMTRGKLIRGKGETVVQKISTDSRQIGPGSLFIPLKGPRFDGHQFIEQADLGGALGSLKEKHSVYESKGVCIEVEDSLKALQDIASHIRRKFSGPVIGVTGSNGKTTTKEMLYSILSRKFKVLKSEGNLNNHIGVPLTLLNVMPDHQMILLEMGINHSGELRRLCEIARPTLGIITNIGETHLEGLGSLEGVAEAKGELLDFLGEGTAILNRDSPFFEKLKRRQEGKVLSFGLTGEAFFRGTDLHSGPDGMAFGLELGKALTPEGRMTECPVRLSVPGTHNVYNALAAAASAFALGCSVQDISTGLKGFSPVPLRSERIRLSDKAVLLSDAYNANPSSMEAAVSTLAEMGREEGRKTIAILGDMLELGSSSAEGHFKVGQAAGRFKIGRLFLFGPQAIEVRRGALEAGMEREAVSICRTHEEIALRVRNLLEERSLILLKGSRGMKMEKILDYLKKE